MKYNYISIYIFHIAFLYCQETLPLTSSEKSSSIKSNLFFETDSINNFLIYRGFVVRYNYSAKSPNYTIHQLTFDQIEATGKTVAKRRSSFWIDDIQLKGKSSLNIDFKGSGYDRGHMVPAGDFVWDQITKNESFVLSNICAQSPQLNRGIWNQLEQLLRMKVLSLQDTAYVITGAIYNSKPMKIGIDSVWIAQYFYKIFYLKKQNRMYAFLFDHSADFYSDKVSSFQVRVDDIERILDEDFYDRLPDNIELKLESELNILE